MQQMDMSGGDSKQSISIGEEKGGEEACVRSFVLTILIRVKAMVLVTCKHKEHVALK